MFPSMGQWRGWLALIALAGVVLVEFLHWEIDEQRRQEQYQHLVQVGADVRAQVEARLSSTLFLSTGLVTYIESQSGEIDGDSMTRWLSRMLERDDAIRNIGVAPDNRIQFLYPLEGNEAALGLYYPDLPEQWPEVEAVIKSGQPVLAGPLPLVQGGTGLIYRAPVYVEGDYWGLVSTVLDAPAITNVLDRASESMDVTIQLYRLQAGEAEVLWGAPVESDRLQYTSVMSVPGATWRLRIQPKNPDMFTWVFHLSAYALLLLIMLLGVVAIRSWVRQQVQERSLTMEADELRRSLVTTFSHELRTPLTNIVNALSLLIKGKGGDLPPASRQMIEMAERNAEKVLTRVDEWADQAWSSETELDFNPASHVITDLVEDTVRSLSSLADSAGVAVVMGQIEPNVHCLVDPRHFNQAMTTLMTHAIETAPKDTQVEVSVREYGQWCEIAVHREGQQEPKSVADRATSAARPRSRQTDDQHGVRMALIKTLIEGMGGTLTVIRKPSGTAYRISFPSEVPKVELVT